MLVHSNRPMTAMWRELGAWTFSGRDSCCTEGDTYIGAGTGDSCTGKRCCLWLGPRPPLRTTRLSPHHWAPKTAALNASSEELRNEWSLLLSSRSWPRAALAIQLASEQYTMIPMVLILPSFRVPRDPTAKAGLPLRRCSEKTPAASAQARKLFARRHSAG